MLEFVFFFQAEDGIRDRSPSRGLGDVYKRQNQCLQKELQMVLTGITREEEKRTKKNELSRSSYHL